MRGLKASRRLPDLPAEVALKALIDLFRTEVLETRRKHVLRLIMTEGPRFPALAEFYHREVVSRGLKHIGELLRRSAAKGELSIAAVVRFPQLVFAPLLMAVMWDALFARIDPLDVDGMLAAHRELLVGKAKQRGGKT